MLWMLDVYPRIAIWTIQLPPGGVRRESAVQTIIQTKHPDGSYERQEVLDDEGNAGQREPAASTRFSAGESVEMDSEQCWSASMPVSNVWV